MFTNLLKTIKEYIHNSQKIKKVLGIILIFVGLVAIITPVIPGIWILVIGLQLLGIHILFLDKLKFWRKKIT